MKKTLCLLLSLIIAVSCCTIVSVSAVPAEWEVEEGNYAVYLLGDVDMDMEITVIDATLIQRAEAGLIELSGLQQALADITGNGMDVTNATLIQRELVGLTTAYPIGENIADENEGVVYRESLMLYQSAGNDQIVSIPDSAIFSTAYPDVAFISAKEAILGFAALMKYQLSDVEINGDENFQIYTLPNGASVIFDYDEKQMIFSDYSTFVTMNGTVPLNPYGSALPASLLFYETQDTTKYFGSDPVAVSFSYDTLPMLKMGEDIVIPLQTYTDFYASQNNTFVQYNGKAIYIITSNTEKSEPNYWKQYNDDTEKRETISRALAQVNYYELCACLEARYGLKKAHDIDDFDSYFRRRGLRDEFLSRDVKRIETAVQMMGILLFEDFHSASHSESPFLGEKLDLGDELNSPIFNNRIENWKRLVTKRRDVLGDKVARYERRGDTVFITFDSFDVSHIALYYAENYELSPDSNDTIELFAYALKRLQNEDSDAKNVVIDIACNGGGAALACGFAMDAIIGKAIICVQNPNTSALTQNVTKFDLNLDGSIDDNDISMKAMGKNIAVVMSDCSFSCGNLLPCSLNALDDDVLLMGQQSGGGACVVTYITTTLGSTLQISGEQMLVTMKNGYIRDIDAGAAPEVPLTLNRFFDRDYIVNVVNEQFG